MSQDQDPIGQRGRAMEDVFFHNIDAQLVERLKAEAESEKGRDELIRNTGISDETLIAELVSQGISAKGLLALRLIPLVLVAWADKEVSDGERKTVLAEAAKLGIEESSVSHQLLDRWLQVRPAAEVGDAWKRYTVMMLDKMRENQRQAYVTELKRELHAVAKASGGVFGFGKVSQSETRMIDLLISELE
jgi:hypothetical protein